MALTMKQKIFCQEYLVDLNATQAAIRANYSTKTARQIGTENLSKPAIQCRVSELQAERAERCKITADEIVERLRSIADMWQENPSAAVRALELLGRHLGIFEKDNRQQSGHKILQIIGLDPLPPVDAVIDGEGQ